MWQWFRKSSKAKPDFYAAVPSRPLPACPQRPSKKALHELVSDGDAKQLAGDLNGALADYEAALRRVTPDDHEIEMAMALAHRGKTKTTSVSTQADKFDSALRARMVAVLRELKRYRDAEHHAEIAVFLDEFLYGETHNDPAASWHDLGLVQWELGRRNAARTSFGRAEAIDARLVSRGLSGEQVAWRRLVRADYSAQDGYLAEAAQSMIAALPAVKDSTIPILSRISALDSVAQCLQNIGEHTKARSYMEAAVQQQTQTAPSHLQMGRFLRNLALLYHELGMSTQADETNDMARGFGVLPQWTIADDRAQIAQWRVRAKALDAQVDVVISHNTADEEIVQHLHTSLSRIDLRPWTFKQLPDWAAPKSSTEIMESVGVRIRQSRLLLVVVTGNSLTSEYVFEEIELALKDRIAVILWFPEGARIEAQPASTRSNLSDAHLLAVLERTLRPGVRAFYGYGLRQPNTDTIAVALKDHLDWLLNDVYPTGAEANLKPTRMPPIVLKPDGSPLIKFDERPSLFDL